VTTRPGASDVQKNAELVNASITALLDEGAEIQVPGASVFTSALLMKFGAGADVSFTFIKRRSCVFYAYWCACCGYVP